jgi:3-dehydroquinate dehydratase I
MVVGSIGNAAVLRGTSAAKAAEECDLVEIRLDALAAENALDPSLWQHLSGLPLLFTARCQQEGGAMESTASQRTAWLKTAINDAAAIDIEVASLAEMSGIVAEIHQREIPLVASYHDFSGTPPAAVWREKLTLAHASGASVFKAAARVHGPADVSALATFQATDHRLPVAMMGMGPLAAVSRLMCAQYGCVLNYGYLGTVPTAPGQWSAVRLKQAIASLESVMSL